MQLVSKPFLGQTTPTETPPLTTATLDVAGMKCAGCVKAVERQLTQQGGVVSAQVNLITQVAVIQYDPQTVQPESLAQTLTARGFPSQLRAGETQTLPNWSERRQDEQRQQVQRLLTAALLLCFSALGHLDHWGGPRLPVMSDIGFHWALATLALFIPGREIILDGARGLWYRMPNMNTLVGLGTLSAYTASCVALAFPQLHWECFFDEPVMLLGFIFLGRTLEGNARGRAAAALEQLMALQPRVARLVADGQSPEEGGIEIPVELVRVGEWVQVLPGEKIPVDGEIVLGQTTLDESMLTGEATPVFKEVGATVAAGTLNLSGAIALRVTQIGSDTALAKIIASVEAAQIRKAPVQKLVDTVAGYFAYGVMTLAALTFLFWSQWGTQLWPQVLTPVTHSMAGMEGMVTTSPVLLSLKLAIAVLVVACPCALGLATPTAILVGTSLGAERGILIKGGDVLEQMHRIKTIVFDKTGTLTVGQPKVTDCCPWGAYQPSELLQLAASVEKGSNHPLASALVAEAQKQELPLLAGENFHTEAGLGVVAQVTGQGRPQRVLLGNQAWLEQHQIKIPEEVEAQGERLAQAGKTVIYVAVGVEYGGLIAVADQLRQDAAQTVQGLQEMGLEVVLLTGDRPTAARAIAQKLGIEQIYAQVSPSAKAALLQTLQNSPTTAPVAMVGDGINDAPALAQADVSIALQSGTEIAMETASIILMASQGSTIPLHPVLEAIQLSQATFKKIRQNLFWALSYNSLAIPIAAGVLLPSQGIALSPPLAGGFMALSSVLVVTNSLLLRRHRWTGSR
ncbi:heavy metal translocating P-type ATPase [Spirulina subsalsa]|uniref:heavy metal translocating P-type ATPase n=1 Tax=Spirulina subsalsa TaxID=54311 RepID=UPI000304241F|nr:heavy metal translocating P-type ATPase [Spirulina subsalsa]